MLQSFFQFIFDVQFELHDLGDRVRLVMVPVQKVVVNGLAYVEFHCVVTGSDGFDVPLNVLIFLNTFDIVDKNHGEEVDKHSDTANDQAF